MAVVQSQPVATVPQEARQNLNPTTLPLRVKPSIRIFLRTRERALPEDCRAQSNRTILPVVAATIITTTTATTMDLKIPWRISENSWRSSKILVINCQATRQLTSCGIRSKTKVRASDDFILFYLFVDFYIYCVILQHQRTHRRSWNSSGIGFT